ncbi:hypothetical protein C3L33_06209, partial [Rhododendron williamsianum]
MDSDFWTSRLAAAKRQFTLQSHHNTSQLDRLNIDDFEVEDEVRPDFPCPYCYEDFDIASLCSHLEDEHSFESKSAVSFSLNVVYDNARMSTVLPFSQYSCTSSKGRNGIESISSDREKVCPVCSVRVPRDMLSHITLQHGNLFKISFEMLFLFILSSYWRRRRLRRVAIPNSQALSLLGRDLREAHLQVLLGGSGYRSSNANSTNAATDPFLSSLILNFPASESEDISKSVLSCAEDSSTKRVNFSPIWKARLEYGASSQDRVHKRFDVCKLVGEIRIFKISVFFQPLSLFLCSLDPSLSYEEREKRRRQASGRAVFLQDLLVSTLLGD